MKKGPEKKRRQNDKEKITDWNETNKKKIQEKGRTIRGTGRRTRRREQ